MTEITNLFFGDRAGRVRDPQGNIWWIHTHIEDVDAASMALRSQAPGALEARTYVEESLAAAMRKTPVSPGEGS